MQAVSSELVFLARCEGFGKYMYSALCLGMTAERSLVGRLVDPVDTAEG